MMYVSSQMRSSKLEGLVGRDQAVVKNNDKYVMHFPQEGHYAVFDKDGDILSYRLKDGTVIDGFLTGRYCPESLRLYQQRINRRLIYLVHRSGLQAEQQRQRAEDQKKLVLNAINDFAAEGKIVIVQDLAS